MADAAAWQAPTLGAAVLDGRLDRRPHPLENPEMPWSELEALFAAMPERSFRQEILAEFIDDGGGVFRGVRAASTLAPGVYHPRHEYVIGVDWGRTDDFTVFCVLDATTGAQVALARSNQVEYEIQRQRLVALCERWQPSVVLAEANSIGAPIIERLQREDVPVMPFTTTAASKQRLIDGLALAFERGRVTLLDDPVQIAELEAYAMRRTDGGLISYGAPAGMHDDTVIALALAWSQVAETTAAPPEDDEPLLMRDRPGLLRAFPALAERWK